jgi:hypothetical protein
MEEYVNQFVPELLLQCSIEKHEHVSDIEYKESTLKIHEKHFEDFALFVNQTAQRDRNNFSSSL